MSDTDKYEGLRAWSKGHDVPEAVLDREVRALLADLTAANAHIKELEAERLALTLRNDELQRMVDAGLEQSSTAAREAVK